MSAVVNETFRMSSIIPGDVLHSTTKETQLGGYTLPKGTIVMPNLYQVHHDEKYWGDPENFRPERFLNPDGTLKKEERVIPFSIGKRVCVAEGLAQVQFFLFLTGVLQHFEFLESPEHPLPGFKPKSTFSLSPYPYKLVLRERPIRKWVDVAEVMQTLNCWTFTAIFRFKIKLIILSTVWSFD